MKVAIIVAITAGIANSITTFLFALFNFHYSISEDGFDLFLFLIDTGIYVVIFLLIFTVMKKLFLKGEDI